MAGKGGARAGAGRKKGTPNSKAMVLEYKTIRAQAIESGELPHEFLLRVSRGEKIKAAIHLLTGGYQEVELPPTLEQRIDAAKAAAPFFAPRLAQIEQKIEIEEKAEIADKPLTEVEWSVIYGAIPGGAPGSPGSRGYGRTWPCANAAS